MSHIIVIVVMRFWKYIIFNVESLGIHFGAVAPQFSYYDPNFGFVQNSEFQNIIRFVGEPWSLLVLEILEFLQNLASALEMNYRQKRSPSKIINFLRHSTRSIAYLESLRSMSGVIPNTSIRIQFTNQMQICCWNPWIACSINRWSY